MATTFIGVDLAWSCDNRNSGMVALTDTPEGASLTAIEYHAFGLKSVVEFIAAHRGNRTIVAIGAPLVVRVKRGQRPCETELSKRFVFHDASAYSSNLGNLGGRTGPKLVRSLEKLGFRICLPPSNPKAAGSQSLIEVYPLAAQVTLLDLENAFKYKKVTTPLQREGLTGLRDAIREHLVGRGRLLSEPQLIELLEIDIDELKGRRLNGYEDTLDALLCAYTAYMLDRSGWNAVDVFGDQMNGAIVIPRAGAAGTAGQRK